MMQYQVVPKHSGKAAVPRFGVPMVNKLWAGYLVSQSYTIYLANNPPCEKPMALNFELLKYGSELKLSHADYAYIFILSNHELALILSVNTNSPTSIHFAYAFVLFFSYISNSLTEAHEWPMPVNMTVGYPFNPGLAGSNLFPLCILETV